MCNAVAAEFVRHEQARLAALPAYKLTKETLCRSTIATSLHENIDHVTILIDGTPQILLPATDLHEDLVEMPRVAEARLAPLGSCGGMSRELLK